MMEAAGRPTAVNTSDPTYVLSVCIWRGLVAYTAPQLWQLVKQVASSVQCQGLGAVKLSAEYP